MDKMLRTLIKMHRAQITPKQRRNPIKAVRFQYPWQDERKYAIMIKQIMKDIINYTKNYLAENYEAIARGDDRNDSRLDAIVGEEYDKMVSELTEEQKQQIEEEERKKKIIAGIMAIALGIKLLNQKHMTQQITLLTGGVPYTPQDAWWNGLSKRWAEDNYNLIKNLSTEYIDKINMLVEKAVNNGTPYSELTKQINSLSDTMSDYRARLIARDQIGKLNGTIQQMQQLDAGADWYIWRTAGDERVRAKHKRMNGKLCSWKNASIYSEDGGKTWIPRTSDMPQAHPGQEIQCRCWAEGYFTTGIAEIDAEFNN